MLFFWIALFNFICMMKWISFEWHYNVRIIIFRFVVRYFVYLTVAAFFPFVFSRAAPKNDARNMAKSRHTYDLMRKYMRNALRTAIN